MTVQTVCARALLASILFVGGCHSASAQHPVTGVTVAASVDGRNLADALRTLDEHAATTPALQRLRDEVTQRLAAQALDALDSGDLDLALAQVRQALVYYTPAELDAPSLPDAMGPTARALLAQTSAHGDEAHALAAARVLMALRTPDPESRATWARILAWGEHNRQEFQRPWVAAGQQAQVLKEVARIIPSQQVLDAASEQIVARRRAAMEARVTAGQQPRLNLDEARQLEAGLRLSGADLAVLFLRVGDLREAANRLTSLGNSSESSGLAAALGAIAQGEGGADALAELAERLVRVDPAAHEGVCRAGRRAFPRDARFARGLAIAGERAQNAGLAAAHMAAAVELQPDDQRTLRGAIEASLEWLSHELGADDIEPGRRAYDLAATLLGQWRTRYAGQLPPVAASDLEEAAAQLELAAGNLDGARTHLERATHAEPPSRDAYLTLAEIAWRHDQDDAALRDLDAGLALPLRPSESDSFFRPMFAVRRALAMQSAGRGDESRTLMTQTLSALDALARATEGRELARTHMQRAVALEALGRRDEVRAALNAAIEAWPDGRDIAAQAVAFCLGRGMWRDARDLARDARTHLTLDRPWQVYFALWGVIAGRMGHLDADGGARAALDALSADAGDHAVWQVRLAQRYAGRIERDALLRHAHTTGQRAEALFYDAMLRLTDDATGAEGDLRQVLATEVVHYYEYDMAWEVLRRRAQPAPSGH